MFGKELLIWFTVRVFSTYLSMFVCVLLSLLVLAVGFGILIVLILDHSLSIYFFQIGFSFVRAAVACAIFERTSGF